MGGLVEDLLCLARLDELRPLQLSQVSLPALVIDVVHDARTLAAPDRPLTMDVHEGVPLLCADESRLRQVLANQVDNALQHTASGTPIAVRVATCADRVLLEVADSGPGMTDAVAARVFERSYRADASRTRTSGGSGLGLSIVAAIVAAHGGALELDTAPGRGATFRVLQPVGGPPT